MFAGCKDWRKNNVAGGMQWPDSQLDKGPADAGPPDLDLHVSSGTAPDINAPRDMLSGGKPDVAPALMDQAILDQAHATPEMGTAGKPPMPDASADSSADGKKSK